MEEFDDYAKLRALPGGWSFDSIGNLFDIRQGKSLSGRQQTGKQLKKFLRTSNVLWGRLDLSNVDEMDFSPSECETLTLKSGDLLVCEGGDIGRTAVWRNELADCYYQNHLHRLRAKDNRVNPQFVMFWMQAAITLLRTYEGFGNKTTIPNLSRSRLSEFMIPVPEESEQKKIAAVLWKIQKAVDVEHAIVRNARDLKKSLLRRLFTHGLRGEPLKETEIGPLPESWDADMIANRCDIRTSAMSYGELLQAAEDKDGVWAHGVKVSDMNLAGNEIRFQSAKLIKRVPESIAKRRTIPAGAIIFPKRGAAIATNKKRLTTTWTVLDPNLIAVVPGPEIVSGFLLNWFATLDLASITEPGPTPQLNKKNVAPLRFPKPQKDEQREIAGILQTADRKIDIHESKTRSLQDLFKTTLHKLLTAQIRVNDLDIDTEEVC